MTGIHDAQPGDIFVDGNDKLWRVMGRYDEPCVMVEAVEPDSNVINLGGGGSLAKQKKQGGVSGLMWKGFRFIFRPQGKHDVNLSSHLRAPLSHRTTSFGV